MSTTKRDEGGTPDAVVVGGGLVGLCAALHLQRTGRQLTVVERGSPGDGASGHNAGIFSLANCVPTATPGVLRSVPHMLTDPLSPLAIRWSYLPRLSPWLVRFALSSRPAQVEATSKAIKSLLDHALDGYAPFLAGCYANGTVRTGGHLHAYQTDKAFDASRPDLELRARRGVAFQVLDATSVAELEPLLAGRARHGVYIPDAPYALLRRPRPANRAARTAAWG